VPHAKRHHTGCRAPADSRAVCRDDEDPPGHGSRVNPGWVNGCKEYAGRRRSFRWCGPASPVPLKGGYFFEGPGKDPAALEAHLKVKAPIASRPQRASRRPMGRVISKGSRPAGPFAVRRRVMKMYALQISNRGSCGRTDLPPGYGEWEATTPKFAVTFAPEDRESCTESLQSRRLRALASEQLGLRWPLDARGAPCVPLVRAGRRWAASLGREGPTPKGMRYGGGRAHPPRCARTSARAGRLPHTRAGDDLRANGSLAGIVLREDVMLPTRSASTAATGVSHFPPSATNRDLLTSLYSWM